MPSTSNLRDLLTDIALLKSLGPELSGEAMFHRMKKLALVNDLRQRYISGEIQESHIREAVKAMFDQFVRERKFIYDAPLALLAVVLHPISDAFSSDFLEKLSQLDCAEMPLSPRVAFAALRERKQHLFEGTHRTFHSGSDGYPLVVTDIANLITSDISSTKQEYELAA